MRVATVAARSLAVVVTFAVTFVGWPLPPADASPSDATSLAEICPEEVALAGSFPDVTAGKAHASAIFCLHSLGVVQGNNGLFRPDGTTTRGHLAIALFGLLALSGDAPAPTASHPFADVANTHVAHDAIAALAGVGIIQGTTATTFEPNRPIDRAQLATLLDNTHQRTFGQTMPQGPTFSDIGGTTHEYSIRRLVGGGITVGYDDGTYRPRVSLSRAQMASFLTRYLDLLTTNGIISIPVPQQLQTRRVSDPARTIVEDPQGAWVATFTDGARTVALAGPSRRFDEATAAHGVTSSTWVRVLPAPFAGQLDGAWLARAREDTSPDVLATSMQYLTGAPKIYAGGVLVAGDASYGPLRGDTRPVGSDWHDYQGVVGTAATTTRGPIADRYQSVDCSGYMRLLWGVRSGLPLTGSPNGGAALPRRATQQANEAPGVVPIRDRGTQVTDFSRLQSGDLVFFDATPSNEIDHVGVYLGPDDAGRHRFVSSRRSSDGPTMGDYRGASLLDGNGLYARTFRATRRL